MAKLFPINIKQFVDLTVACEKVPVTYSLGAKADLHAKVGSFHHIDCSGFVRWAIFQATGGITDIGDGSYNQMQKLKGLGVEQCSYHDAVTQANPKKLFLAVMTPETGGGVGHVWAFTACGAPKGKSLTCESHGGKGVDRRSPMCSIEGGEYTLETASAACFLIAVEA